ncbi:MAG: GGDEF domain-containing protein [Oscillospiraceae bacterium]|nr:GGDEF domain-containing protein [Oscillospiraceae bacterium]
MGILNLAVIISGIDEEYQSTILSGIHEFAQEHDINIAHFVAFGGVLGNIKNDVGEFNIYNLINYEQFDGAILLTNTIASPKITQKIVNSLRKSGIPASSIDFDFEDFYHVGIDNKKAMKEVVTHLIEKHGVRTINYVSGPAINPESILRFEAYTEVLGEHQIPFDKERVFQGSFRERDGRMAVTKFLNSSLPLPDAIVCANDAMAIGTISTLEENGIKVPEDIIVTGFDNIYNARNYYPSITSVDRPLKKSGRIACSQIYNCIKGVEQPRSVHLDTRVVEAMSCGCMAKDNEDTVRFKKDTYRNMEIYHRDVPMINQMACNLAQCDNLDQNIEILKKYIEFIECEKFYLCLCDDCFNFSDITENNIRKMDRYTIHGYTESVKVPLVYCNGQFGSLDAFDSAMMLPDLYTTSPTSNLYYFSPIHFRERCLGYCVICNTAFPLQSPLFHTWIMNIGTSIENIRKLGCIENALSEVEKLYIIDPLSMIYNRNGFRRFTDSMYNDCIINKSSVMLMFADMDRMKYINDNFGHKEGDSAIRNMAQAVESACMHDEICARFGGDEFIVFACDYTEEKAQDLMRRIYENVNKYNEISGKPYKIELSIGWHIEVPERDTKLNTLITKADQKMYREKKKKPYKR